MFRVPCAYLEANICVPGIGALGKAFLLGRSNEGACSAWHLKYAPGLHLGTHSCVGSHQQLMDLDGKYAVMVQTQNQAAERKAAAGPASTEEAASPTRKASERFASEREGLLDAEREDRMKGTKGFKRTAKYNLPEWHWIVVGVTAAAAAGTSYPLYAVFFAEVLELFYAPVEVMRDEIWIWCVALLALGVMNFFAYWIKIYALSVAGERLTTRLRIMLFKALVHQDIGWFDMPGNESGSLCAKLAGETTEVCCAVLHCAVPCCAVLGCAVLGCAVLGCAVLRCAVLRCAGVCCAGVCCAGVCCAVLCCSVPCWGVLGCAAVCCAGVCCAVLFLSFGHRYLPLPIGTYLLVISTYGLAIGTQRLAIRICCLAIGTHRLSIGTPQLAMGT